MHKKIFLLGVLLLAVGLLLAACQPAPAPEATECPEVTCPECPECPEAPACPEPEPCPEPAVKDVPFLDRWLGSGHANKEAEAFNHWNEDDPAVVPVACAKCHSTPGYLDYIGADGTEANVVDADQPIGTTVECVACHNDVTVTMDSVLMPSGVELTGLGDESRCMQCHQGRHSKVSVDAAIEEAGGAEDPDAVLPDLGFANIHYFAAAATKYGTLAMGGYQYDGKTYDGNFAHVEEFDTCIECHDSHTLEVKAEACQECHTQADFKDFRMFGSLVDYDGDGNMEEGIYYEIETLQGILYGAIQDYAANVAGTPIVYDSHAYPYFFIDTNANGEVDEGEAAFPNRYASWTPRLLRAAYNYQLSVKDPGGFAHGGKYIIELLYDSIEDLNPELVAGLHRIDHGHFAGSEEAFRHWDEDGEVSGSCSRCHSATGLELYLKEGAEIAQPISNGFLCVTCHDGENFPARYETTAVTFPSGAVIDSGNPDTNLCMNCHQGRASSNSISGAIAGLAPDEVSESLRFINVHYFAAGASRYGTQVKGGYEFPNQTYVGYFEHVAGFQNCTECHDAHALEVKTENCFTCHATATSLEEIRISETDFDGDGDVTEGLVGEIETLREALYSAIVAYANDTVGTPIVYDSHAYPYFFTDTNGDGVPTPDEANYGNRYATWTPNLLAAAYNYQYAMKDPGGFAHNGKYIIQLLIDSIQAVGGDVSGYVRP